MSNGDKLRFCCLGTICEENGGVSRGGGNPLGFGFPIGARASPPLRLSFLPLVLTVGHGRFPPLADGAAHVLGQLQNVNQVDKLFFRNGIVVDSKIGKENPSLLFVSAALEVHGVFQLLLHSCGSGRIIRCCGVLPMNLPYGMEDSRQVFGHSMISSSMAMISAASSSCMRFSSRSSFALICSSFMFCPSCGICRLIVPLPLRLDARSAVYWHRPYRGGGFDLPARIHAPVKSSSCCWYCNSRAHITSLWFLTFARLSALPGRFLLL